MFDLCSVDSFKRVEKWIEEVKNYNKGAYLVIVGNKADVKPYTVDIDEITEYSKQRNLKFFLTSAYTGEGIAEVFQHVLEQVVKTTTKKRTRGNKLNLKTEVVKEKKSCC